MTADELLRELIASLSWEDMARASTRTRLVIQRAKMYLDKPKNGYISGDDVNAYLTDMVTPKPTSTARCSGALAGLVGCERRDSHARHMAACGCSWLDGSRATVRELSLCRHHEPRRPPEPRQLIGWRWVSDTSKAKKLYALDEAREWAKAARNTGDTGVQVMRVYRVKRKAGTL